jgi:sterol desaturase/sphingolipid hydroxylase (fatty acid hydroxylase superfamily)
MAPSTPGAATFAAAYAVMLFAMLLRYVIGAGPLTVEGLADHLPREIFPAWPEARLGIITANHHGKHHRDLAKNSGFYFNYWDRALSTEKELA